MSDIAKWTLLVAAMLGLIAAVVAVGIFDAINVAAVNATISQFTGLISPYVGFARGLINYLVFPQVIPLIDVILFYLITRPFVVGLIMVGRNVYVWIFK